MATLVYAYSAGSGQPIVGGRQAYPAWRPAPGTFANVSLNTLFGARPTGWPTGENGGPFANWGTIRWNPDFGAQGGLVCHCSGHLNTGQPVWGGVWVFDVDTQTIVGRNVPPAPLVEGQAWNGFFESLETATLGHTYVPHVYGGLVIQSAANGGGPDGSLIKPFMAGASIESPRAVHRFDLSSPTAPATRVIDDIPMNGSSSSYPAACPDEERGGFWLQTYNGFGPLKFVSFADWSVTSTSTEYSDYGDQVLIKLPPPYDAIIAIGRANSNSSIWSYRVCLLTGMTAGSWNPVTPTGTAPSESKDGASWCPMVGKIIAKPNRGSSAAFLLSVPSTRAELIGGAYSWSTMALTGAGGATWAERTDDDSGQYGGGIVSCPEIGMWLHWDGINNYVQAVTPVGL